MIRTLLIRLTAGLLLGLALIASGTAARVAAANNCPPDVVVATPRGYPTKAATVTVFPGITTTCVVHLPGGAVLYADGDTAASYQQPHPAGQPLQGRAIFRISGSGLDDPNGINIVVTASSSDVPTAPELLPALFADARLALPPGAELVYFEPGSGRFVRVANAHLRRAGLYKIIRNGAPALPPPAPPALPTTLPATGGSPFSGLLALAAALVLLGVWLGHGLLRHPRRMTRREWLGGAVFAGGLALAAGTGAAYAVLSSQATPQGFGVFADIAGGPAPRTSGAGSPPTRLRIARLGIDTPVVALNIANGAWQVPSFAAGYLAGGAWPGHAGNETITGHDDRDGAVFRHLDELRRGDVVQVFAGSRSYSYSVIAMRGVPPTRVDLLRPTRGAMLTLITCTPYLVDSARLVVRAQLVP